jgi:hypothetical protein
MTSRVTGLPAEGRATPFTAGPARIRDRRSSIQPLSFLGNTGEIVAEFVHGTRVIPFDFAGEPAPLAHALVQGCSRGQQPDALRETAGVDSKTPEQLQRVGYLGPQSSVADLGETCVRLLFRGGAVAPIQPGQQHAAGPGQCRAELLAPGTFEK